MTETLNRRQLADLLNVSPTTIDRWNRARLLPDPAPSVKLRGRRWSKAAITAWRNATIQSQRCGEQSDDDALVSAFRVLIEQGAMTRADVLRTAENSLMRMADDLCRGQTESIRHTVRHVAATRLVGELATLPGDYRLLVSTKLGAAFAMIARLQRELPDGGGDEC